MIPYGRCACGCALDNHDERGCLECFNGTPGDCTVPLSVLVGEV